MNGEAAERCGWVAVWPEATGTTATSPVLRIVSAIATMIGVEPVPRVGIADAERLDLTALGAEWDRRLDPSQGAGVTALTSGLNALLVLVFLAPALFGVVGAVFGDWAIGARLVIAGLSCAWISGVLWLLLHKTSTDRHTWLGRDAIKFQSTGWARRGRLVPKGEVQAVGIGQGGANSGIPVFIQAAGETGQAIVLICRHEGVAKQLAEVIRCWRDDRDNWAASAQASGLSAVADIKPVRVPGGGRHRTSRIRGHTR